MSIFKTIAVVCSISLMVFAEKSSIAFYDSLGVDKTAEFGWAGGKANGHFFIKQFQDGSGMKLEDGNLTVDGTITASHLYGDIDAGAIQGTISADRLDSIPWGKISGKPETTGSGVSQNSIGTNEIINGAVDSMDIAPSSIGTYHLRNGSVTAQKVAPNSIGSSLITDGTIDSVDMAASSIGSYHLRNGAVTGQKLAANSVDSNKILNGSISGSDIRSGTITDANLATISGTKINPDFGSNTVSTSGGLQLKYSTYPATLRLKNDALRTFQIRRSFGVDSSCLDIQMDANGSGHFNDAITIAHCDMEVRGKLETLGEKLQVENWLNVHGYIVSVQNRHISGRNVPVFDAGKGQT